MGVAFISHPDCALHEMGPGHPESPARLTAIADRLVAVGLDAVLQHYEAPLASRSQLEGVHDPVYVDSIFRRAPAEGLVWLDPDTAMNPHTLPAALRAAGAVVYGVDLVMAGEAACAYCNVRPPGHHATADQAMGFCIFNNVAVGAAHALVAHGLKRVAIVDFDVHHGNGTEAIFRAEPRVMLCSTFQHPYYPFSGADTRSEHIVNVPLPAGCSGARFAEAVRTRWLPALETFRPQLILMSAGFDGHAEDDMAQFRLTEQDYAWVTAEVRALAERHAHGRVVSTLEGGYNLSALGRSVAEHLNALLG